MLRPIVAFKTGHFSCCLILTAATLCPVRPLFSDSDETVKSSRRPVDSQVHWAFSPIQPIQTPPVNTPSWLKNEIDSFILANLEKQGVAPSPEADRATLIRRVYLDLIGLPPEPDDVDSFVKDQHPDAFERLVDQLLASPRYGERWSRIWLDAARYADSDGYEKDRVRPHAWRWRDWVINALNNDIPFDDFTVQQIAGDLLPKSTPLQKVATGFHRNTLINTEGGVDREEDRIKRTVDRANTVSKVWLGITLQCAQCHDHKYDPISQEDYYQFFAFFNNLDEVDIAAPLPEHIASYHQALIQFERQHEEHLLRLKHYEETQLLNRMRKWESDTRKLQTWHRLKPIRSETRHGSQLHSEPDHAIFVTSDNKQSERYRIYVQVPLEAITAFRLEVLPDKRLPSGGPGLAPNGNFVLTHFRVSIENPKDPSSWTPLKIRSASADFSQDNRPVSAAVEPASDNGWAIHPQIGMPHSAIFHLSDPVPHESNIAVKIELEHALHSNHNLGKFRISATDATLPVPSNLPERSLGDIFNKPFEQRSEKQQSTLIDYFKTTDPTWQQLKNAVTNSLKQKPVNPDTLIKAQTIRETATPRQTYIHIRGDFLNQGNPVKAQTPSVLPAMQIRGQVANRLDLAEWITSPQNPLTSRVIANRHWQHFFGQGIVTSEDDFGTQGTKPSHPALLDWLANRFSSQGWSFKELCRSIVLSATYRQSSQSRPEVTERDPYNTWLARQNRLRVEAEIIRDMALKASGLLYLKLGGESVRPPQPADIASLGFQGSVKWPTSKGRQQHRRGLYTFFQRTVPYPMLLTFDAADSNLSCTRRDRSNTSLQALTLWNDPVFFEAAQFLARRMARFTESHGPATVKDRIRFGFQLCLTRKPLEPELDLLNQLYLDQLQQFKHDHKTAQTIVGNHLSTENTLETSRMAAFIAVARTLFNTDEFITRD